MYKDEMIIFKKKKQKEREKVNRSKNPDAAG